MRSLFHIPDFVRLDEREALLAWLATLRPLWERRYSALRPPPRGEAQRTLLRPVYWLGNWQFACLDYYHPTRRRTDSAVRAEPFPPVLRELAARIESRARKQMPADIPRGWVLNTCLVNFYGSRVEGGREVDAARVGAHKDDEPGPVGSINLGERALFQFVPRGRAEQRPVHTAWLADRDVLCFGGAELKEGLLHRVQRVEDKAALSLPPAIPGYRTRRVNLTLRYVPEADIQPLAALSPARQADVREYVERLAEGSAFWAAEARAAWGGAPAPG